MTSISPLAQGQLRKCDVQSSSVNSIICNARPVTNTKKMLVGNEVSIVGTGSVQGKIKAPFFRTDPPLSHKCENIVIFRPGNLNSLCSPGNQDYQKIIHFFFHQKSSRSTMQKSGLLMTKIKNINTVLIMLVSWATN